MVGEQASIQCPRLSLESLRFFVAEDNPGKVDVIEESLDHAGLLTDGNLTIARTLEEAKELIAKQTPGSLDYNIFLLDGNLDINTPGNLRHGADLISVLFSSYVKPISKITAGAKEQLKSLGLTSQQQELVIPLRGAYNAACERFVLDALFVGISRDREGALPKPAQFPWLPYQEVGGIIAKAVLSSKENKSIKNQQRRKEQEAQANIIRQERARRRALQATE